ncbi:MAG: hypothetical protein D6805_09500 [Planctomycetota bacterium]|nr:MAG: hypothetical protein D6805_09500 [Planctomycetota bacterium]
MRRFWNRRSEFSFLGLILGWVIFSLSVPLCAQEKVEDIITLKNLGYSEEEILEELRGKKKLSFTEAELEKLKKAGVGKKIIDFLRKRSLVSSEITLEQIRRWHRSGKSSLWILKQLRGRKASSPTAKEALALVREGVDLAVLYRLKRKPLQERDVVLLARKGTSLELFTLLLEQVGVGFRPSPKEALALLKKGVKSGWIKLLIGGKYHRKGVVLGGAREGDWARYEHVGREFLVVYPRGWRHFREYKNGEVEYFFTPDSSFESARVGFGLRRIFLAFERSFARLTLAQMGKKLDLLLRAEESGLKVVASSQPFSVGGHRGLRWDYRGGLKGKTGEFAASLVVVREGEVLYLLYHFSPVEREGEYRSIFRSIYRKIRLGLPPSEGRARRWTATELVERFKSSVVCVFAGTEKGFRSSGSGFIIRRDGYVITNHHVVWDGKAKKFYTHFQVAWDSSLGREPVKAVLVGAKREWSSDLIQSLTVGGADIALLKIVPPGPYSPVRLTPLKDVKLGDPVLAMGFPRTDLFGDVRGNRLSLFVTKGGIVRFNRDSEGRVKSIYTDAKITHGNSGGPCFDLATGGVFGINTFGAWHSIEADIPQLKKLQLGDLVGYYGVIPLRYVFEEFPEFTRFPAGYERRLSFQDRLILTREFLFRRFLSAARRQIEALKRENPFHGEVLFLEGFYHLLNGELKVAMASWKKALKRDPAHQEALVAMGTLYLELKDYISAAQYAQRALEKHPQDYNVRLLMSRIYLALKRYEEARREAQKAAELVHHVLPEPFVLIGKSFYGQNKLDEGKSYFQKAVEANLYHIGGWLGLGEYFERKGMYESAILEYGKLGSHVPNAYEAYEAIGRCYQRLKNYSKAYESYMKGIALARKSGITPSEELLYQCAYISHRFMKQPLKALKILVHYYNFYGFQPSSWRGHLEGARIYQDESKLGLAYAHYKMARGFDLERKLPFFPKASLSVEELRIVSNLGYTPAMVIGLVKGAGVNFILRTRKEVVQLAKQGIAVEVILYILQRQRSSTRRVVRRTPSPAVSGLRSLVGKWSGTTLTPQGFRVKVFLWVDARGKFQMDFYNLYNNILLRRLSGRVQVEKNVVTFWISYPQVGKQSVYFQREGNVLKLGDGVRWDVFYLVR